MEEFEGRKVATARIAVTNAGDGLSQAMAVEPAELTLGSTVYLVLEAHVAKVRYEQAERDSPDLVRVHVLRAGLATMVDERVVRRQLNAQCKLLVEAAGQAALFEEDGED